MNIDLLLTKYNDEMEVVGKVPAEFFPVDVWNTPISFKQNYLDWISGGKPMFIPMSSHCINFAPALIPDTVARHFVMEAQPQNNFPDDGEDMFGITWQYVPTAGGSMVVPGKPQVPCIEDWANCIELPDVASWDWDESAKTNEPLKQNSYARKCWLFTGFFERLVSWLDFENAAVAMIDEDAKDDVRAALDAITRTYEEIIPRVKQYYDVDIMYVHDDWGSQMAPFFSYDSCKELIVPYLKRVVSLTHDCGMIYDMHSCGNTGDVLLPLMIEAGVDSWYAQPMNDYDKMFDEHGDEIRLQVHVYPLGSNASEQDIAQAAFAFLDRYSDASRNAWAAPFFPRNPRPHPKTDAIWYAVSREYYATH